MKKQGEILNAIHQEQEANLYGSNYVTFWKRQNHGDSEKTSDCQEWEEKEDKQVKYKKSNPIWDYNGGCMSLNTVFAHTHGRYTKNEFWCEPCG